MEDHGFYFEVPSHRGEIREMTGRIPLSQEAFPLEKIRDTLPEYAEGLLVPPSRATQHCPPDVSIFNRSCAHFSMISNEIAPRTVWESEDSERTRSESTKSPKYTALHELHENYIYTRLADRSDDTHAIILL